MSQQPPWDLMGWSKDHEREAFEQIVRANLVIPFVIQGQGADKPGPPIWEFAKRVNGGQHLPTLKQAIGDCCVAGTMVLMGDGSSKPIEKVNPDELVISQVGAKRRVTGTVRKSYCGDLVTISSKHKVGPLTLTPDHRMMLYDTRRWINAADVRAWDKLEAGEEWAIVDSVHVARDCKTEVYCLEVETDHTFIANGFAISNCVSFGCAQAGQYMSAFEVAWRGQEEEFKRWYPPYIYGMSRCAPDLGNGRLGNGDGSTGAWGAGALQKYGVLFADDAGVPAYSGSVAKQWGRSGPPREFQELAKDNPVKSCAKLSSVNEIRDALINYHPCTIASMRGFEMQPVNVQGFHVFKPSGSWPHQMCLLAWMDSPFAAAYRLNSWGMSSHGNPLNGEPAGGAWNRSEDLERELKSGDVEVYALSAFEGFPGRANFSPL